MSKQKIKVDIISDVVCPWCYIGKRRLEQAIDKLSGQFDFELEYHPFELNPDMPAQGSNQREYLSKKFGGDARYLQITNHVTQVASQEGLAFHFEKQAVSPNTRSAHRIIHFAKSQGKQLAVVEAFFKAYFTDGIDLSKNENLVAIAISAGLHRKDVESLLKDDSGLTEVVMAEKEIQKLGISGVPFYIIDNQYGVSGAQASEAFIKAFREIKSAVATTDEACDIDGENC